MSETYAVYYFVILKLLVSAVISLVVPVLSIGLAVKFMRSLAYYDRE